MEFSESIFDYSSYRSYLNAVHAEAKLKRPRWSYGCWIKVLGLRSPAAFGMILNGQRHPGESTIEAFSRFLNLTEKEAEYFEALVELEKNPKNISKRVSLMERLAQLRSSPGFELLDLAEFQSISDWHYYAIRELTTIKDFKEDCRWIANVLEFKVSPDQVRHAISQMLVLGLLERTQSGRLKSSNAPVGIDPEMASVAIRRYHAQSLSNGIDSLKKHSINERDFFSSVFPMPQSKMPEAKRLIREFHDRFCDLLENSAEADAVYQLEVGLFPLAKVEMPKVGTK